MPKWPVVVVGLLAAAALAACGSTKTVTQTAPATGTAAPAPSSGAALARYEPSTVVSSRDGSMIITSPDSVEKLNAHYASELSRGGWEIVSKSVTRSSADYIAKRGNDGATISIYKSGSGSGASINIYPV